jgi:hypothetical protein
MAAIVPVPLLAGPSATTSVALGVIAAKKTAAAAADADSSAVAPRSSRAQRLVRPAGG